MAAPSTSAQDGDQAKDQTSVQAAGQTSIQTDDQNGEKFYMMKFCITCHGKKGVSIAPNYPNLAKQNEQYLANQVKDIIKKKRANKLTLLMTENPVVISISDEEIAAVALHLTKINN